MRRFLFERYGEQETVDSLLNDFVTYRNDAAHGNDVDSVLGAREFVELAAFLEQMCSTICECISHRIWSHRLLSSELTVLGAITEVFVRPQAVVAKIKSCQLTVNQDVVALTDDSCKIAKILGLKINDVDQVSVTVDGETEIGIKFDTLPPVGTKLITIADKSDLFLQVDI